MPAQSISIAYRFSILAALSIVLAFASFTRNPVFMTDVSIWAEAAEQSPGKQRALHNYGCALAKDGRYTEAISVFDKVLSLPYDGSVLMHFMHLERGNAYYHLKQYDNALSAYKDALIIAPADSEALTNIAVVLMKQGKRTDALAYAKMAVETGSPFATTFEVMGDIFAAEGKRAEAVQYYLDAIRKNPGLLSAYKSLAGVYETMGQYSTAIAMLNDIMARAGDSDQSEREEAFYMLMRIREKEKTVLKKTE